MFSESMADSTQMSLKKEKKAAKKEFDPEGQVDPEVVQTTKEK